MYLPELNKHNIKKKVINSFKGINRSGVCSEEEFFDTENISSDCFPALCSSPEIYELDSMETGSAVSPIFFLNRRIGYITSFREDAPEICRLIYNGNAVMDLQFRGGGSRANILNFNGKTILARGDTAYEFDPGLVSVGNSCISTVGYSVDIGAAHDSVEYNEPTLCISLVYEDGCEIGAVYHGSAEFPDAAEVNDCYFKDLECYRLIFKGIQGQTEDIWQPVVSLRLRLELGDGYRRFKAGDYVRLKGLKYWNWAVRALDSLDRFVRIHSIDADGAYITEAIPLFEDYTMILMSMEYPSGEIAGYGTPIVNNTGNRLYMLEGNISSCMPEIDMMCMGANRIWACNSENREIYATELGSARNWSVYEGLSSDSYSVSVGSPGDFTACCSLNGTPVFFKENEMIIINGSRPSSFTLTSYNIQGVPRHSPDGVCVHENSIYYIACDGVYMYNGSRSVCISCALGDSIRNIRGAVLCVSENKLYVCGRKDDACVQYVYDIRHGTWHRQSAPDVIAFLSYPDTALQITHSGGVSKVYTTSSVIPLDYELVGASLSDREWIWESGDISNATTDKKYVRRILIDTECEGISELYVSYDKGSFFRVGRFSPHIRGSSRVCIFPKRCDSFRLRMKGKGRMLLYNITMETEEASENG